MSRDLLAFLLSELKTVRIVCRGQKNGKPCSSVIEVDVDDLGGLFHKLSACPLCGSSFCVFDGKSSVAQDGFLPLLQALNNLKGVAKQFEIEFVLLKKG